RGNHGREIAAAALRDGAGFSPGKCFDLALAHPDHHPAFNDAECRRASTLRPDRVFHGKRGLHVVREPHAMGDHGCLQGNYRHAARQRVCDVGCDIELHHSPRPAVIASTDRSGALLSSLATVMAAAFSPRVRLVTASNSIRRPWRVPAISASPAPDTSLTEAGGAGSRIHSPSLAKQMPAVPPVTTALLAPRWQSAWAMFFSSLELAASISPLPPLAMSSPSIARASSLLQNRVSTPCRFNGRRLAFDIETASSTSVSSCS